MSESISPQEDKVMQFQKNMGNIVSAYAKDNRDCPDIKAMGWDIWIEFKRLYDPSDRTSQ